MNMLKVYRLSVIFGALAACNPESPAGADESSSGSSGAEPGTTTAEPTPTTGAEALLCTPGQERCADDSTREVCTPTGRRWEPTPCDAHQTCTDGVDDGAALCVGPCELATASSVGCEFVAIRVRSSNGGQDPAEYYDALVVGNPDSQAIEVQLYFTPDLSHQEAAMGAPVLLAPGEAHIFELTDDPVATYSTYNIGGVYRVKSDLPVVAYLHSPLQNSRSNDASLLLPVRSLRGEYVITSYPAYVDPKNPGGYGGRPSYFNVVALEDNTLFEWTPPRDTAGDGVPVKMVPAFETGQLSLLARDIVQIGARTTEDMDFAVQDISGTVVRADKPVWVLGGTSCARVPFGSEGFCNHLQEQMIPTEYWGTRYIAAHSPLRGKENHYWRVYAGADKVQVWTDPGQAGGSWLFEKKGDFVDLEVPSGKSFTFQGLGPFMPVQYLASNTEADGIGDPAMYQTIPVDQFLERYVFVTGAGYGQNYAQVVRLQGAADVLLNGEKVTGYYSVVAVGLNFEVADVPLGPGETPRVFVAESDDAFSVSVIGYTTAGEESAYAYPGGMKLEVINEG